MLVTQLDKGNAFRPLHHGPRAFIIPNAWDAGSTRILAGFGFSAIATSSWASANVYGRRDHGITREQALAHGCDRRRHGSPRLGGSRERIRGEARERWQKRIVRQQPYASSARRSRMCLPGPGKDPLPLDIGEATERVAAAVEATRKLGFTFLLTAWLKDSFMAMPISTKRSGVCRPTRKRAPTY